MEDLNNTCVYAHIRLDTNDVFYIGIGNSKRPFLKSNRNKYWRNIANKTGYKIELLSSNLTWENAQESEIELIKIYGRKDLGLGNLVNMTDGGEGSIGLIVSKETRIKNGEAAKITKNRKGTINSLEHRIKISESHIGRVYKKGYKRSEEIKAKISEKQLGRRLTDEWKTKISESLKGRKISEKNRQITINRNSIKVLDTSTGQVFSSIKNAAKHNNLSNSHLCNMLKGNIKNKTMLKYYNNKKNKV